MRRALKISRPDWIFHLAAQYIQFFAQRLLFLERLVALLRQLIQLGLKLLNGRLCLSILFLQQAGTGLATLLLLLVQPCTFRMRLLQFLLQLL